MDFRMDEFIIHSCPSLSDSLISLSYSNGEILCEFIWTFFSDFSPLYIVYWSFCRVFICRRQTANSFELPSANGNETAKPKHHKLGVGKSQHFAFLLQFLMFKVNFFRFFTKKCNSQSNFCFPAMKM